MRLRAGQRGKAGKGGESKTERIGQDMEEERAGQGGEGRQNWKAR
jgi:hypothetical protein